MILNNMSDAELDRAVAMHVMRWEGDKANASHLFPGHIQYAWEVVRVMEERGFVLSLYAPNALVNDEMSAYAKRWEANFAWWRTQEAEPHEWPQPYHGYGVADTPSRAICIAALAAMGYKDA